MMGSVFPKIIIYLIIICLLKITAPAHEHIFEQTKHPQVLKNVSSVQTPCFTQQSNRFWKKRNSLFIALL